MSDDHDPSGHSLAEAAHAAGAVQQIEPVRLHDVRLHIAVKGTPEHADAVAMTLVSELSARSDILSVEMTLVERRS